jgi:hypothetical protein
MIGWLTENDGKVAWALMCTVLAVQYLLFQSYAEREIVWAYPNNHDQAAYLQYVYTLWLECLDGGVVKLFEAVRQSPSNGVLLQIEGVIMCLLFGASRMSCLTLNFLHFAALQVCLFLFVRWLTGNTWLGFVGVGLVLSQQTAFFWAGGLFDFRLDFAAYCLFGIWVVAIIRSRVFEDRKWTLIAAVIAACLVLSRFITVTYIMGTLGLIGLYFTGILVRHGFASPSHLRIKKRLVNMALFGLAVSVCVGPILFLARQAIWDYYVGLHFIGSEKHIRAAEMGITGVMGHLTHYPKSIWLNHFGSVFVCLSLSLVGIAFLTSRLKTRKETPSLRSDTALFPGIAFSIACILSPLMILTMDVSKSPVVGGITAAPTVVLGVLLIAWAGRPLIADCRNSNFRSAVCLTLALLSISVGAWNYFFHLNGHGPFHYRRSEINQLINIYDSVGTYCRNVGWDNPNVSMNTVSDRIDRNVLAVMFFERTGHMVHFRRHAGGTVFPVTKEQFFEQLGGTDVLIVEDLQEHLYGNHPWPFYASMILLRDDLRKWAEKHLAVLVKKTSLDGAGYTVYVRPSMKVLGLD